MKARNLVIAMLAVLVFVLLSLPYQWEFSYWAEALPAWIASFVVGIIAAVYGFYAFLQILQRLISEGKDG